MMIKVISLLTCFFAFSISIVFAENVWVIHAGSVLVTPDERPLSKQTIVVRDNIIEQIEKGYITATDVDNGAKLIDLKDQFVLPGLMDMHVHLLDELSMTSRTDLLYVTTSMQALTGAHFANKTLMTGITTVRDLGGNPEAIYALRDAVSKGLIPGPRIFAAGSALAATGGTWRC